jgi:polyisoprenyl-phosphate glycosyltransferase
MKKLSVIVPLYNEQDNLAELYDRLKKSISSISKLSYEIIFVNDGSKDNTLQVVKLFAQQDKQVKFISFSRNFGHQIAVCAGLDVATGDVIVIIDADLQDPPELIAEMYARYQEGYKVVYAKRNKRKQESFFKIFTAKVFYRILQAMTSFAIPVDVGDFRLVDKSVIDALKKMEERQKFLRGQIAWLGFSQTAIYYDREPRKNGVTGYSVKKMLRLALDGITSFSDVPLKFASILGFASAFFAFVLFLYALFSKFIFQTALSGWTSLIISVLFVGGVQLFCLGIIGEYISRIYNDVRKRPLYIIDETNINQ